MQVLNAFKKVAYRRNLVDTLKLKLHTRFSGRAAYQLLPNVNGAIDDACLPDNFGLSPVAILSIAPQRFIVFVLWRRSFYLRLGVLVIKTKSFDSHNS